jgi:hypothetical protein
MTITKRYLADLKDLLSLHLACSACNSSVLIPFSTERNSVPVNCPQCEKKWFIVNSTDNAHMIDLIKIVRDLQRLDSKVTTCKLSIELSPPSE